MSRFSWSRQAREVVCAALEEGLAAGLAGRELERHVSSRYPFGPRENYPYKVWCAWVRRLVKGKRGPLESRPKKGPKLVGERPASTDDQKTLFDL